jgi:hypothetical protein
VVEKAVVMEAVMEAAMAGVKAVETVGAMEVATVEVTVVVRVAEKVED